MYDLRVLEHPNIGKSLGYIKASLFEKTWSLAIFFIICDLCITK